MNGFNCVESSPEYHAARCNWLKTGACSTRADRVRECARPERENEFWIDRDTWCVLIGCPDSYHFNNWTSIISL